MHSSCARSASMSLKDKNVFSRGFHVFKSLIYAVPQIAVHCFFLMGDANNEEQYDKRDL